MAFHVEAALSSENRGKAVFKPVEIGNLELLDLQTRNHKGDWNHIKTPAGMKMWIPETSSYVGLDWTIPTDVGTLVDALQIASIVEVPASISMVLLNRDDHQEIAVSDPGAAAVISRFYKAHDSWMVINHQWNGKDASVLVEAYEHSSSLLPGVDVGGRELFHYTEVRVGPPVNPHLHALEGTLILSPGATFVSGTEAINPVTST